MRLARAWRVGALAVVVAGCRGPASRDGRAAAPVRVQDALVTMPRAYPGAVEALVLAHRQAGLRYAIVPPKFEGTLGPFGLDERVRVKALCAAAAAATGTDLHWVDCVAVFEPRTGRAPPAVPSPDRNGAAKRRRVARLAAVGRSSAIADLSRLAADPDPSVRLHAVAALARLEGDFWRREWPGRVSVFEVYAERVNVQALRFALEQGGPEGGPLWQLACDLLGRARDPYLVRRLWSPVSEKDPGTMRVSLWAMGRSGDPSGGWALRKRIVNSFTNHVEDQYLAGVSMGRLGLAGDLRGFARDGDVDVRRAAVLGLGLCEPHGNTIAQLTAAARDPDQAVAFVACQSLARLGAREAIEPLLELATDTGAMAVRRCAALEALVSVGDHEARSAVLEAATDGDPRIRARAADLLGDLGGTAARLALAVLIEDDDHWVRASAAAALGRLGDPASVRRVDRYFTADNTDGDGMIAGVIGLGRGRSPAAGAILNRVAADPEQPTRLRSYAVLALAQLKDRAGQPCLVALTERGTPWYLPFALRHLELETPRATARYLIPFLAQGDRDASAAAANRLAELGDGAGVAELLEGFDVFDNSARMMHMWGAIRAEGPGVTAALVEATASPRAGIRDSAALALGGRVEVAAVDALIRLTADENASVRSAAAQSLGLTGDPVAIPALVRLAEEDPSAGVASEAIRALRMRAFAGHPDVRAAFARLAGSSRDAGAVLGDPPPVSAQPANSFVLRRWAGSIDDDEVISNVTYETSLTYDSDRRRVVLWGSHGRRADSPQTGQTWFYDAQANTWKRLTDSREWPNGTCLNRGTTYDPANRVVISPRAGSGGHGWVNGLRANLQWSIPWVLDAKTDQWYPARPAEHQGDLGQVPGAFDPQNGVITWWQGKLWVYDAYANEWTRHRPTNPGPGVSGDSGCAFDPKTGRLIVLAPRGTWAFDPAANTWTDLKPGGPPGPASAPFVYDSANDVMLAFVAAKAGTLRVWVYHLRENRWEEMPQAWPCPHYGTLDVAYDSANNVAVISGGWQSGRSGETTVRETWTYRYKPVVGEAAAVVGPPLDVSVVTRAGGAAVVSWKPPAGPEPSGYRVYRGAARYPWLVKWEPVGSVQGALSYSDPDGGKTPTLTFFRVTALDQANTEGPPSLPARTVLPCVRWAAASLGGEGVRLTWAASSAPDLAGYHVYRAAADLGNPWLQPFDPARRLGAMERLTKEPVKEATYLDCDHPIAGAASELAWPKTVAYVVKAVNAWGLEGGPSPVSLALPDAPGPVRVIPWVDGRRLVLWTPGRAPDVVGHHVMRMDDWHRLAVFRWNASPIVGAGFYDDFDFPTADRRRYYVHGVDAMGAVGIPSSGAWSHGFP